ncbi:MAG: protein kinase [Chloroflexota bacterium]|nr:protein kinase [Chloroflexota bacterium]
MMMETIPPGTILRARYRIERALGSGGFGHVYQAIDTNTGQQCAIKEYMVTGSGGQAQLQHEARMLSVLHHPNLPMFLDAFSEHNHYYIVLSYIDGNDLTDYIRHARQRNEPIPLQRVMNWLIATCDAVQFLHSQQPPVIHRDIKPDNIRITPDGTVVLVDLGNAKAIADGARTLFFARHQGTPGYAPPEQYPGGTGTDARSDVYALGGTLYFALTTHEPPSVSTRNQALQQRLPDLPTLQELLASNPPEHGEDGNPARQFRLGVSKPAKPVPRHLRHLALLGTLPPELLERLNNTIKRAMALKPADRYQSVADLARDLRRVLEALPVEAPATPAAAQQHRKDPHGTEPDLPMLYEALQAAKERAQQQVSEPAPEPPPVAPASTPARCSRCGAIPVRQAVFCAQCGAPLPPASGPNDRRQAPGTQKNVSGQDFRSAPRPTPQVQVPDSRARNRPTPPAQLQQASMQAPIRSSGPYSSQVSSPKPPQFMHTNTPPQTQGAALSTRTPTHGSPGLSSQHTPVPGREQGQAQVPRTPPATPSHASGFDLRIGIIIAVVVLIILLALLIVLFLTRGSGLVPIPPEIGDVCVSMTIRN